MTSHSLNYWSSLFGGAGAAQSEEERDGYSYEKALPSSTPIQNNFEIFTPDAQASQSDAEGKHQLHSLGNERSQSY